MTTSKRRLALLALATLVAPSTAFAHTGIGDAHGLSHGFTHPIGGVDHILAMVAVGMFAACLRGRALWLAPATFVAMMAAGGVLGINGVQMPFVEVGIAASVIVLGLAVALQISLPTIGAMGLVGLFALFHGHAHGAEMPVDASSLEYALGFMAATALLHAAGVGLALAASRIGVRSRMAVQTGGGAMALAGVAILTGWL